MGTVIYKSMLPSIKADLADNEQFLTVAFSDEVYAYQQAIEPEKLKQVIERSVRWDKPWKNMRRPYQLTYQLNAKGKWTGNLKVLFPNQQEKYYYEINRVPKGTKK